jgi:hypothetical protein
MIVELRGAVEHAQQLSEDAQRLLAAQVEEWLDESEWDTIVGSPHEQAILAKLVAEAREEIARGEVEEGGFGE